MSPAIAVALLLAVAAPPGAQERIVVGDVSVYPGDAGTRLVIDDALARAATLVGRDYPEVELAFAGTGSAQLTVNAVSSDESDVVSLALSDSAGREEAVALLQRWDDDLYRTLARQIYYLWSARSGFAPSNPEGTPRFVDELDVSELVGSTINVPGVQLYPQSVTVMPDGDVVIGCITTAVRLAPDFSVRSLPGLELVEAGNYNSAMTVAATPAGTLVTRPSMGRDLYVYQPGVPRAIRMRAPVAGTGPVAALGDGSIVVTDFANRAAAVLRGRRSSPINIYTQEYSFVPAIAAGPEGNLWAFDTMDRQIRVFSPEGVLLDTILPLAPADVIAGTRALSVGKSGDFVILGLDSLHKFDRRGRLQWSLPSLGQMQGVAYDPDRGALYLADYLGQRIVKYVEPAAASEVDRDILLLRRELDADPDDVNAMAAFAEYYERREAFEMAQSWWRRVLDSDPFHLTAPDRIDALEEMLLLEEAERIARSVLDTLDRLGPESARADFGRAIRLYEEILFLNPRSERGVAGKQLLEEAFSRDAAGPAIPPQMEVASLSLHEIFPSLVAGYQTGGAGTLTMQNVGDTAASDITVSYFLPSFMTGPERRSVEDLPAGEERTVPLSAVFDRRVLELSEDLAAQVEVTVTFRREGGEHEVIEYGTTTVHRRTALVWDRSEKLASFITPNEEVVAGFALRLLGEEWDAGDANLTTAVRRALHIVEGIGRYRIAYIEDPHSPISEILGSPTAVDTVRFPRTTLYYRTGDCDDTTALLASLLEAAGIETAILTSPGHVFLAFNTEEPEATQWMFETDSTTSMNLGGTLWLPLETTILDEGFLSAWQAASELVTRHRGTPDLEFIPVRPARSEFPALSLAPATISIAEPSADVVLPAARASWQSTTALLYESGHRRLEEQLDGESGRRRAATLNRLGVLHARFGRFARAESTLQEALDIRPDYVPALVNLANAAVLRGQREAAVEYLRQAEAVRPDSPSVLEQLVRLTFEQGQTRETARYYDRLTALSPARAERVSLVVDPAAVGRASEGGDAAAVLPPPEWPVSDE